MQARAAATDELLSSGALRDLTAPPDADIERQLAAMSAQAEIDRQIDELKGTGADGASGRRRASDDDGEWLSIGQGS